MLNQVTVFIIFILNGFIVSILFDIFRVLRKAFKTSDIVTYIEDTLFWILSTLIVAYSIFKFNEGIIRVYIFIGILFGVLVYMLIFSKTFISIYLYIIKMLKILFKYMIIKPLVILLNIFKRIIYRPITFIIINIKKTMSIYIKYTKNMFNHKKNKENKKDLV